MPPPVASAQPINAFAVFKHAESFYHLLDQLHKTSSFERVEAIIAPLAVNSAFASELYLKAALYNEKPHTLPITEHLLDQLFNDLPAPMQQRLRELWDQSVAKRKEALDRADSSLGQKLPRDLDANLQAGSDAFRIIRYLYEGKKIQFNLGDLPIILRQAILEIKPDWTTPKPPSLTLLTPQELGYLQSMQKTGLWGNTVDMVIIELTREGIRHAMMAGLLPKPKD